MINLGLHPLIFYIKMGHETTVEHAQECKTVSEKTTEQQRCGVRYVNTSTWNQSRREELQPNSATGQLNKHPHSTIH